MKNKIHEAKKALKNWQLLVIEKPWLHTKEVKIIIEEVEKKLNDAINDFNDLPTIKVPETNETKGNDTGNG